MNLSTMWLIEILNAINSLANLIFLFIFAVVPVIYLLADYEKQQQIKQWSKVIITVFTISLLICLFMPSKELLIEMFGG